LFNPVCVLRHILQNFLKMLIKISSIVRKAIADFKGPLVEKIPDGVKFKNERFVGEMNEDEKILWSIFSSMKEVGNKVAIDICGKKIDDMSQSEIAACEEKIEKKVTKEQKSQLIDLHEKGNLFYEAVFESITDRFIKGTSYNSVVIRQGWKVYAGNRESGRGSGGPGVFSVQGDRIVFH
jgi:hypothetical protein